MIYALLAVAVILAAAYLFYGTVNVEVTETTVRTDRIDGSLKIVHITDLHGRTGFWTGSLSAVVESLKPDIICITGDLFNRLDQLPGVLLELRQLTCPYQFFVPGNHEREERRGLRRRRFSEEEYRDVLRTIGSPRLRVLANDGELIELNDSRIFVYGFDNSLYGRERYMPPADDVDGAYRLVLAHSPSIARFMAKKSLPYDLALAGHTHGGQIRLLGKAIGPYGRWHSGLKEMGPNRYMYVSRGIGTIHLPFRVGCRPEVALIRLVGTSGG